MKKKLLIIGFVWPEPKSSAAGTRILQLITQFKNQDFDITFTSAAKPSERSFNFETLGIKTQYILLNDDSFDVFISELNPDLVLFDRFMTEEYYGWRVADKCPNALRILDTEDFHGLRKARQLALKEDVKVNISHLQNDITKREIASIYRCDLTLIISEAEVELLTTQFKINKNLLYYLPFLLEPISEDKIKKIPTYKARQHFITIGNFLHAPNYDAVLYLKQHIWPLIKAQLPKAEMHIYGAYETQKVTQLNNKKEGFIIKGFAEDVNQIMQNSKVCLAPLRFGAGLKGKLIAAMQNGTSAVMTTIAAEGLFGKLQANGFIENNPEAFAKHAITLYTDKQTWENKQRNGFKVLNQRFTKTNFESDFALKIKTLVENIKSHRETNFMGQLLMHHSLQSTKYLSKWIAEKNNG